MTLPASGAITMAQIASEIGISATGLSLNDSRVRALAGVPSGPISFNNLHGKTYIPAMPTPGWNGQTYAGGSGGNSSSCTLFLSPTAGTWQVEGVSGNVLASGTYTTDTAVSYQYTMTSVRNSGNATGTGTYSSQGNVTSWTAIPAATSSIASVSSTANGTTAGTWVAGVNETFTLTISPVLAPSNTSVSTITLSASSSYTIAACVAVTSYLPNFGFAGDVEIGDILELSDHISLEADYGVVSHSRPVMQLGFRFVTSSGASLRCSGTAPIPTRTGRYHTPKFLLDEFVAVRRDDSTTWEKVIRVEDIGDIMVQHITVGDRCFWAGEQSDAFILHHNIKQ